MERREKLWLSLLVAASAVLHLWMAANACAPAQDTIRFMNYARRLLHERWAEVVTSEAQHPLFPVLGALAVRCVEAIVGRADAYTYWRALQGVSALAGVLCVPAVFLLARQVVGGGAAIWATAVFALAPRIVGIGADGLSDSLHLLFVAWGLVWAVRALEGAASSEASLVPWLLAGLSCGLAFLTRPEGGLVLVALMVTAVATWGSSRSAAYVKGSLSAAIIFGMLAGSFVLLTGKLSTKASVGRALGLTYASEQQEDSSPARAIGPFELPATGPQATVLRPRFSSVSHRYTRRFLNRWAAIRSRSTEGDGHGAMPPGVTVRAAIGEYLSELGSATQYVPILFAVPGLLSLMRRRNRGKWLLIVLFVLFTVVLLRLYLTSGYISMRHVLVPVLCMVHFIGEGLVWLTCAFAPRFGEFLLGSRSRPARASRIATATVLAILCGCYLPVYGRPLHESRAGAVQAARWLATNAAPGETVLDPHMISGAFAGLRTYSLSELPHALEDPSLRYIVMDVADLARNDRPYSVIRSVIETRGEPVAVFSVPDSPKASVAVFCLKRGAEKDRIAEGGRVTVGR